MKSVKNYREEILAGYDRTDVNDPIFNTTIFDACDFYGELNVSICCQGNKNKFGGRSIMSYAKAMPQNKLTEFSLEYNSSSDLSDAA